MPQAGKRGRPQKDPRERKVPRSIGWPAREWAAVVKAARRAGLSAAEWIRRVVRAALGEEDR